MSFCEKSVVELPVARAVEQRDGAASGHLAQGLDLGIAAQFVAISFLEFRPAFRLVIEPFAQVARWCGVLHPGFEGGLLLGNAARPETIDEDARAVVRCRLVIDTLDPNGHRLAFPLAVDRAF